MNSTNPSTLLSFALYFLFLATCCTAQKCTCASAAGGPCFSTTDFASTCGVNQVCGCSNLPDNCPSNSEADCLDVEPAITSSNTCACSQGQTFCADRTSSNIANSCSSDTEVCPCSTFQLIGCPAQTSPFTTQCRTLVATGAQGDPHFTGFDGLHFDFHGAHLQSYVLFGEQGGDVLVASVRATDELYRGINKTYFTEFGLQVEASSKIHIFTDKARNDKAWKMRAILNGVTVVKPGMDFKLSKTSRLTFDNDGKTISITTANHQFTVRAVSMKSDYRHHVDFKMSRNSPSSSGRFTGVLGMTLSRKLGSSVHESVVKKHGTKAFEMEMRKYYKAESLFPSQAQLGALYRLH